MENAQNDNLAVFLHWRTLQSHSERGFTFHGGSEVLRRTGHLRSDSDRVKYAKTIRNSKGDGIVETIVRFAKGTGAYGYSLRTPQTFDKRLPTSTNFAPGRD